MSKTLKQTLKHSLECPDLCPGKNLLNYLDIRLTRSSDPTLFISTTKPFKPVSRDTIARWIKNTMKEANIARLAR